MWSTGKFTERDMPNFSGRNWTERGFTIGIGGSVSFFRLKLNPAAGTYPGNLHTVPSVRARLPSLSLSAATSVIRTTLVRTLSPSLLSPLTLVPDQKRTSEGDSAVVTNDIFTREDQEFLIRHEALSDKGRIRAIETGASARSPPCSCPPRAVGLIRCSRLPCSYARRLPSRGDPVSNHLVSRSSLFTCARETLTEHPFAPTRTYREDISANLGALEELQAAYGCEMLFVESGGDNLAANYSRELADYVSRVECGFTTSSGGEVFG